MLYLEMNSKVELALFGVFPRGKLKDMSAAVLTATFRLHKSVFSQL